MEKDYITITKNDGSTQTMEVIATFNLEETSKDYIIYKSIAPEDPKFYAASYDKDTDYSNLDTNLSESEKNQLNKIFENLKSGGDINA